MPNTVLSESQINDSLHQTANDYPRAWQHAHVENDPERYDYIVLAVQALYAMDSTCRGNWRRGVEGDLSMDGISVCIDGQWRFADVIGGAGGPNPTISYHTPGSDAALKNSSGKYIGEAGAPTPDEMGTTEYDYGEVGGGEPDQPPCPNPDDHVKQPYAGDEPHKQFGQLYLADLAECGRRIVLEDGRVCYFVDEGSWIWSARVNYDDLENGMTLE